MAKHILLIVILVSYINSGFSNSVPYVTKCGAADVECIKSSAQVVVPIFAQGIPELGVENLEPAVFKKPIDASSSGLKLIIYDFTVSGLKNSVIVNAVRDVANSKIIGKIRCNVVGDGTYEMDGTFIKAIPVKGSGKLHTVLRDMEVSFELHMSEKVGKDGKTYWDIKRFSHSFELLGKADVHFENLFSGSDVLARAASDVIEASGNEIVLEVGPPVVEAMTKKVVENIRKFFNHVPAEELALD